MAKVFLTYAAQDQSTAQKIVSDLRGLGIDVWSATDLRSGGSLKETISDQLRQIEAVVVLVSPASITSDPITEEWSTALLSSKRVIPVLINDANFWHLPSRLQDIEALDLTASYPTGIGRLAELLREVVSSPDPKPAELVDIEELSEQAALRVFERFGFDTHHRAGRPQLRAKMIFVIISFDGEMEPTFEAIRSAAERVGMEAERIKDLDADFMVTDTILYKIDSARLVVADLTLERPNVYFELGYARGKGKTVVTLLKSGSKAHVDVRGWNYIEYIDSRPLEEDLVRRFTAEIETDEGPEHAG
ncbi:toll/interleukin-1 receptor domain-containing protein [Actinomadura sp. DC4]|uniref:toll/interleukin-1 receptor domain-containing protein n=1 Tax=Actinomadura sp. DC4 TaxID=3055069 RepID=UPI0025AF095B|nr:toll/interleukin-1 receptor domain-containing protein [Actinomadura sp. DC4]MDN3353684.1 toll/interleukin-1 receptor domain-containing protein [Actinomadura sp. DC4]